MGKNLHGTRTLPTRHMKTDAQKQAMWIDHTARNIRTKLLRQLWKEKIHELKCRRNARARPMESMMAFELVRGGPAYG